MPFLGSSARCSMVAYFADPEWKEPDWVPNDVLSIDCLKGSGGLYAYLHTCSLSFQAATSQCIGLSKVSSVNLKNSLNAVRILSSFWVAHMTVHDIGLLWFTRTWNQGVPTPIALKVALLVICKLLQLNLQELTSAFANIFRVTLDLISTVKYL